MTLLALEKLVVQQSPYPVGCVSPVLPADVYAQLAASFPSASLFKHVTGGNVKASLSEVNHAEAYHAFLQRERIWKLFYLHVKHPSFIKNTIGTLRHAGLLVPIDVSRAYKYKARFEFSLLPADGGCLLPHTDLPSKIVTLVIGMPPEGEPWDDAIGGGTDILRPFDPDAVYADYQAPRSAFTTAITYPYRANQCVAFLKSATSWHSVGPMTGSGSVQQRRTLTINIERFPR